MKTSEVPNLRIRAYSEHDEVYQFAEWLVDDYFSKKKRMRDRQKYILTARKLIASIWLVDGDLFRFTTKTDYFSGKNKKQVWMTVKTLKLFQHLKSIRPKLINLVVKGVPPDVSKTGKGLNTVYCRTKKFSDRLKNLKEVDILPNPELEHIELNSDIDKNIPISESVKQEEWYKHSQEVMARHYELLRNSNILKSNGNGVAPIEYFYQRKFKNDFSSGGRWYSDFTRWSKKDRLGIKINDISVASIDISQLHPTLIMRLIHNQDIEPIGMFRGELKDAYDMPKYKHLPRDAHKKIINTLFNAKNLDSAVRSIMTAHISKNTDGEIICNTYKSGQKRVGVKVFRDNKVGVLNYISEFKLMHPYYAEGICSGVGIKLQYMDSNLVTNFIDVASNVGIPILPVHDEFIFPNNRLEAVKELLRKVFQITFGHMGKVGNLRCSISSIKFPTYQISLELES